MSWPPPGLCAVHHSPPSQAHLSACPLSRALSLACAPRQTEPLGLSQSTWDGTSCSDSKRNSPFFAFLTHFLICKPFCSRAGHQGQTGLGSPPTPHLRSSLTWAGGPAPLSLSFPICKVARSSLLVGNGGRAPGQWLACSRWHHTHELLVFGDIFPHPQGPPVAPKGQGVWERV